MTFFVHDQTRLRRRAGLSLLAVGAVLAAACSGAATELATDGTGNTGTTAAPNPDNETDPAHLASALPGLGVTVSTVATQDGPDESASHEANCAQFTYREDAQAVLEQDLSDPYNLDADDNSVACEELPSRPVQSLPPQTTTTAPPQTAPPTTAAPQTIPPPVDTRTPPSAASGLTGEEQQIVSFINNKIGHALTPEVSLMNAARSGQTSYGGGVSFSYWASAQAQGTSDVNALANALGSQLGGFGSCTHIGVGFTGNAIYAICGTY